MSQISIVNQRLSNIRIVLWVNLYAHMRYRVDKDTRNTYQSDYNHLLSSFSAVSNTTGVLSNRAVPHTWQGVSYGTVSLGPFDDEEEFYEGKGVMHALERVGHIVAEVVVGEDPSQQVEIDARLAQESSLPANVVSAASIACCKAGAKQGSVSVFDQIALVSNNSESGIPALAFSVINGGHLSSSSLWVQV